MARLTWCEKLLVLYGARLPDHPRKWWLHARLRRLFRATAAGEHVVVRKGLTWRLNPDDYTDASLFWLNSRDDWDLYHLKRLLRPGATILDVGANFGYYSLVLATALNQQCRIIASEPNPLNFARMEWHIRVNAMSACVQPVPLGVSDREETTRMRRPQENSGHATIDAQGESAEVQLTTLDDFCTKEGVGRLDLLILDVEGYEQRALQGSKELLARCAPMIFVELFPPVMQSQGSSPQEVVDYLTTRGYQLFVARKERLVPMVAPPQGDVRENVFAFPAQRCTGGVAPVA